MKVRPTKGPWLIEKNTDGDYSVWVRQPHVGALATVHAEDINGEYPAKANAVVMASSPKLIEALQNLIDILDITQWDFTKEGVPICSPDLKFAKKVLADIEIHISALR